MTTANLLVPTAQYLRKSTEHQQYSLENQSAAIQKYAEAHGFVTVLTYFDAAKRGVILRNRAGLRQLLQDVVSRNASYKAILVYDVSRWGRFQDTDESAHYEFLCKASGVPVHYCAESFANDGTLPSLMMKALKRTMAGEFSRELGVKVLAGQQRLARLGFKQGGMPGYGLRRMLVSADGTAKQQLAAGERKSIATDRVVLVPGPAAEVRVVQEIYRMLLIEKLSVYSIARELNRRGIAYLGASDWDYAAVYGILTSPKYAGQHVFGRTSRRLFTPPVRMARSEWVLTPGAFQPIVDPAMASAAQSVLENRTINKSDDELLASLRTLLASQGRLSLRLIKKSSDTPSPSTYRHRFGSVRRAYELIGYGHPDQFGPIDLRRQTQALRDELIVQIATMFPADVFVMRPGGRWRTKLRMKSGLMVSVLIGCSVKTWKQSIRWRIDPVGLECKFVTLLARLKEENCSFLDFHVFPKMDRTKRFYVSLTDHWLNHGHLLNDLNAFREVVARAHAMGSRPENPDARIAK
jgi:DNA invertase Pin-like site-specific DNA recombinase